MHTGKYEKPTPPPGCVWECVTIKLYSELEEAYLKGWLVFESFTSDNLSREVTAETIKLPTRPEGVPEHLIYLGKGPLPEDRQPKMGSGSSMLYGIYEREPDPYNACWKNNCCGRFSSYHYALDPLSDYAKNYWPELYLGKTPRRLHLFGKQPRPNYRSMAREEQDLARARLNAVAV